MANKTSPGSRPPATINRHYFGKCFSIIMISSIDYIFILLGLGLICPLPFKSVNKIFCSGSCWFCAALRYDRSAPNTNSQFLFRANKRSYKPIWTTNTNYEHKQWFVLWASETQHRDREWSYEIWISRVNIGWTPGQHSRIRRQELSAGSEK